MPRLRKDVKSRQKNLLGKRKIDDQPDKNICASAKKIKLSEKVVLPDENVSGFRLIDIDNLKSAIQSFSSSHSCDNPVIDISEKNKNGLNSDMTIFCSNCDVFSEFETSPQAKDGAEVNLRFVYALRHMGIGQAECPAEDGNRSGHPLHQGWPEI
jgi:hypothetical protein